jgi:hypothetical protein
MGWGRRSSAIEVAVSDFECGNVCRWGLMGRCTFCFFLIPVEVS